MKVRFALDTGCRDKVHCKQQERLRHSDQARQRQKRADCDQDKSCKMILRQDEFLGSGSSG
jgi:hypothetical protein